MAKSLMIVDDSGTIQRIVQSPADLPGEHPSTSLAIHAKDIMQKGVIWGSADESVQQALTKMQQADVGYMMVGAEGQLDGIVSKSDITGAVSVYLRPVFAKWRRPIDDATLQIKIKWIMTSPVRTIKPDTSFAEIIENMCQFGMRCLPVIDSQGKVVGSVTVFNIFKLLSSSSDVSSAGKTPQVPQLVQLDL
jgi:CBS-domain-containing membrane protein